VARSELHLESLAELTEAMGSGQVETLIILQGNPVFSAPADIPFAEALEKVPYRLHLGLYEDETSERCDWHLPGLHFLESWSDVRAYEGTASIIQPLIAPLYEGWSEHALLALLVNDPQTSPFDIVRAFWRERVGVDQQAFEAQWEEMLRRGVIPDTAARVQQVQVDMAQIASLETASAPGGPEPAGSLSVTYGPDPSIWDGRFANNAWLQELPKPLSKLTWDNAALINPVTATRFGLSNGDLVRLSHRDRQITLPVWILPGQAPNCLTLPFGYGRRQVGQVGQGAGFDVFPLRTSQAPWSLDGVQLTPMGDTYILANTQEHHLMEGRQPVEQGTLEQLLSDPEHPPFMLTEHHAEDASMYGEWVYESYKWGMIIDLTACVGCNACVVACQAENNIPVVGKDQVHRGREMHWIRIDTYYQDDVVNPKTFFQPLPCMHCEKAPCEVVCPVAATTHSDEGLNEMTYNRCVGTRYCSNNCPYKVRRFNFFQYSDYSTPVLELLRNPDVTVRSRGVMEKCTYCVQRINAARVQAKIADRRIAAGEVETACQAACPTRAIFFGDLNNPQEPVAGLREHPLNYALLADLNTQPRTTFLASMSNPNPRITYDGRNGRT
jgi:molybdopterin-containing oxidoreductase family iron-sulfur binding subunit